VINLLKGLTIMRKTIFTTLAGAVALCAALPAQASTVVDGKCISVSDDAGCLFDGNINGDATGDHSALSAQNAYNLYNNTHASAQPDITLNYITQSDAGDFADFGSITGDGTTSGTWSLPGYNVDFIAVKAGDQFVLYDVENNEWSTAGLLNKNGGLKEVSHIAFFGSVVPEPATWAMMIGGFGLVGGAMRRRKTQVAVTYA
jgi:hypothetical protein